MNAEDRKSRLVKQMNSLKDIPNFKEVQALRNRLQKEIDKLNLSAKSIVKSSGIPKELIKQNANKKRSILMKRNWRFWKLAADRTGLKVSEVRKDAKNRRKGFDSKIPDAIWQNLSG